MVKDSAQPRFHRPRSVPYALKPKVEKELDRLVKDGVLEKVEHSEWGTPIVPVPKKDDTVCICGDYSVTINPVLEVNQYPLPRTEDLFATLTGGKSSTKLDLSHAYNQLVVEEDSRPYLTINTHWIVQIHSPTIWCGVCPCYLLQDYGPNLIRLDDVICYIDNILITGKTDEEHLKTLCLVLQHLQDHGVRVKKKCVCLQPVSGPSY